MKTFIKILKSIFRLAEAAACGYVFYYYFVVIELAGIGMKDFFVMIGAGVLFSYSLYCIACYMSDDSAPESFLQFVVNSYDANPTYGNGHLNSNQRMDVQEITKVFNNYNNRYRR